MESIYLKKLLLKCSQTDCKNYIYLHSEWREDVVDLYLKHSNTGQCYKGLLFAKDFEESAKELEIPLNDFHKECKNVLTSNIGLPGFEIELDSGSKVLRVNKNEEFSMEYLEIKLTEADKNYEMLDAALNIIDHGASEDENQKTNEAVANLVEQVEHLLREKEEWKLKMLRKFLVLLNTKKEKIANLQKKVEKLEKRIEELNEENRSKSFQDDPMVPMDGNASVDESSSDALNGFDEQNDFDAPTQRMTPPNDIE